MYTCNVKVSMSLIFKLLSPTRHKRQSGFTDHIILFQIHVYSYNNDLTKHEKVIYYMNNKLHKVVYIHSTGGIVY